MLAMRQALAQLPTASSFACPHDRQVSQRNAPIIRAIQHGCLQRVLQCSQCREC